MAKTITREELKSAIDAGEVTVVETLGAEHFEQGHLPGANHIHYEAVKDKAPELLPDKHAPIVTYCSNTACRNSEIAANQLHRNPFPVGRDSRVWTEPCSASGTRSRSFSMKEGWLSRVRVRHSRASAATATIDLPALVADQHRSTLQAAARTVAEPAAWGSGVRLCGRVGAGRDRARARADERASRPVG